MEAKDSRVRIVFALLSGLAICCSVMYITADGDEEVALASNAKYAKNIGAGRDRLTPRSIESVDVKKADRIITATPDGRMRLLTFLNKLETEIGKEQASRRGEISAIRAHMARNMEYNAAARSAMKKELLKKMKKNAKRAEKDLNKVIRKTQKQFAKQADLANRRQRENLARSRRTREIMRKNKQRAADSLKLAVRTQQRALYSMAQVTNAKIKLTNKHIALNSVHITENAKKARRALDKAMNKFDNKMSSIHDAAMRSRSKLVAQANAQNKAFRNWANNRVKRIVASTSARFKKVKDKMAKDRLRADTMLSDASSRLNAALSANKALQDKRFRKTVVDIKAAKEEASRRVNAARTAFKTKILQLGSTVKQQTAQLNRRVTALSETVTRNKLEQAKVNRNVHAELMRMVKLGNDRYHRHIKKDKELKKLMSKNKQATLRRMKRMTDTFTIKMKNIHKTMAKDRAHSARRLKNSTNKLYKTLSDNAAAQAATNAALTGQTREAAANARRALEAATIGFTSRLAKMHSTAVTSARKQQKRINKLTGIVTANAVKSAKGRELLRSMVKSNRLEIKDSISAAINSGEQRAQRLDQKMKGQQKKTRAHLSSSISTQISALRHTTQRSLYKLSEESKAARDVMKAQIRSAVSSATKKAKKDLKGYVKWSTGRFLKLENVLARNNQANAEARAELLDKIRKEKKRAKKAITNAVEAQARAIFVERTANAKAIKKSNRRLDANARQMAANAKAAEAEMDANLVALTAKIAASKRAAQSGIAASNNASLKRYQDAMDSINKGIADAKKKSAARFSDAYKKMADERKKVGQRLNSAVTYLNNKLAERSSLLDVRFKKVATNINALRQKTESDVRFARKNFATKLVQITSTLKDQEQRMNGEVAVVTAELKEDRTAQHEVNRKVDAEIKGIMLNANRMHSASKRARGKLRAILDSNKKVAQEEVAALAKNSKLALVLLRGKQARHRNQAAILLTDATKKLYKKVEAASNEQSAAQTRLAGRLNGAKAEASAQLKSAETAFKARVNTLTNVITGNNKRFERGLQRLTGVAHSWKQKEVRDNALLKEQVKSMNRDLTGKIARAITLGEARGKRVVERATQQMSALRKQMSSLASEKIERMANKVFQAVSNNRHKIADNYLSLKAYAATAKDKIQDYRTAAKRKGLSSVGDLLTTLGQLASVAIKKDEGVGAGAKTLPLIFGEGKMKVKNPVSSINFLVDQWTSTINTVQQRWPMGLGKYLLSKVDANMQKQGVLEVDKIAGKRGNYVFINAQAVGLSSKLSDFSKLAVRMTQYQSTLTKMANKVSATSAKHEKAKNVMASPPEWQGN